MSKDTLVVNLLGGPGSGKSTLAAGVFEALKISGVDCELVTEYAKFATWEQNHIALSNQLYITGKQLHREYVVIGKVDVMITDSPLILGLLYNSDTNEKRREAYKTIVQEYYNERRNLIYFVNRVKHYDTNGRNETEEEAIRIDNQIIDMLEDYDIDFHHIGGEPIGKARILSDIRTELGLR